MSLGEIESEFKKAEVSQLRQLEDGTPSLEVARLPF